MVRVLPTTRSLRGPLGASTVIVSPTANDASAPSAKFTADSPKTLMRIPRITSIVRPGRRVTSLNDLRVSALKIFMSLPPSLAAVLLQWHSPCADQRHAHRAGRYAHWPVPPYLCHA